MKRVVLSICIMLICMMVIGASCMTTNEDQPMRTPSVIGDDDDSCGDDDDNGDDDDTDPGDDDDDTGDDDDDDFSDDDDDDDDFADDDDDTGDDDDDNDTAPVDATLVFIHHSVGSIWMNDGGLLSSIENLGISFYDITYGDGWFGDNTNADDWPVTFGQYYDEVLGWELPGSQTHDVVMIKSCFPQSVLWSGEYEQFQGYYNEILDIFEQHPGTGFLVLTPPPYANNGEAPAVNITEGREFAYWLTHQWAQGVNNVDVVDLAGYLNNDQGFTHARTSGNASHFYLRNECEQSPGDSHPTGDCLSAATSETTQAVLDLLTATNQ